MATNGQSSSAGIASELHGKRGHRAESRRGGWEEAVRHVTRSPDVDAAHCTEQAGSTFAEVDGTIESDPAAARLADAARAGQNR
ncbi:hypothetical protein [Paraburkholderia sacchari]|uniref:hypothetical protein n=1 Tax=Paraburkholderia sacchari TaxID=159450 RepID=UPI003D960B68